MIAGVDYNYFWDHQDEYKRLTANKLNNEACLSLCEAVLCEVRDKNRAILNVARKKPISNDILKAASVQLDLLRSDAINAMTMGHGDEVANAFLYDLRECGVDI